jgi:Zn-dependent protease with chaperone function
MDRLTRRSLSRAWRSWLGRAALALVLALPLAAPAREGVDVGQPSSLRKLVPAEELEREANMQYEQIKRQAAAQGALAPADHPQVRRLRAIAARIIPQAERFNPRAGQWQWEINLIGSRQINAFCMPGGKIAFYTGILDQLQLSDDEVAIVMGHEIAHALREHARARIAKSQLTQLGASLLGELVGKGRYSDLFQVGGNLLTLKFSRDDEREADAVGLELAARAGFDPRTGVSLWRKMNAAGRGAPLPWLSTHPSGDDRIRDIERHLPQVMPFYEKAATAH